MSYLADHLHQASRYAKEKRLLVTNISYLLLPSTITRPDQCSWSTRAVQCGKMKEIPSFRPPPLYENLYSIHLLLFVSVSAVNVLTRYDYLSLITSSLFCPWFKEVKSGSLRRAIASLVFWRMSGFCHGCVVVAARATHRRLLSPSTLPLRASSHLNYYHFPFINLFDLIDIKTGRRLLNQPSIVSKLFLSV